PHAKVPRLPAAAAALTTCGVVGPPAMGAGKTGIAKESRIRLMRSQHTPGQWSSAGKRHLYPCFCALAKLRSARCDRLAVVNFLHRIFQFFRSGAQNQNSQESAIDMPSTAAWSVGR